MTFPIDNIDSDYLGLMVKDLTHELKTPLAVIKSGIRGSKESLPLLIATYNLAVQNQLVEGEIQPRRLEMLLNALELAEKAINCASAYINMLAFNWTDLNVANLPLQSCSIVKCVNESLKQYPYRSDEQKSILFNSNHIQKDFLFKGNEMLFLNLLFNLLRGAIYRMQNIETQDMLISTECGQTKNYLFIRHSSKILTQTDYDSMFIPFNQSSQYDFGLGLFFCKRLMIRLNGDIDCSSQKNNYVEYKLTFPSITNH